MNTPVGVNVERRRSDPAAAPCTPHQRLYIRTLMQQLELDTHRATLFHNRFWERARIPAPPLGIQLDPVLCELTKAQASALAAALKSEVPDDA